MLYVALACRTWAITLPFSRVINVVWGSGMPEVSQKLNFSRVINVVWGTGMQKVNPRDVPFSRVINVVWGTVMHEVNPRDLPFSIVVNVVWGTGMQEVSQRLHTFENHLVTSLNLQCQYIIKASYWKHYNNDISEIFILNKKRARIGGDFTYNVSFWFDFETRQEFVLSMFQIVGCQRNLKRDRKIYHYVVIIIKPEIGWTRFEL